MQRLTLKKKTDRHIKKFIISTFKLLSFFFLMIISVRLSEQKKNLQISLNSDETVNTKYVKMIRFELKFSMVELLFDTRDFILTFVFC